MGVESYTIVRHLKIEGYQALEEALKSETNIFQIRKEEKLADSEVRQVSKKKMTMIKSDDLFLKMGEARYQ